MSLPRSAMLVAAWDSMPIRCPAIATIFGMSCAGTPRACEAHTAVLSHLDAVESAQVTSLVGELPS